MGLAYNGSAMLKALGVCLALSCCSATTPPPEAVASSAEPVAARPLSEIMARPGSCMYFPSVGLSCTSPITGRTLECSKSSVASCHYPGREA